MLALLEGLNPHQGSCIRGVPWFIMYLCLYHPENGRDTETVIKWTLSPCY